MRRPLWRGEIGITPSGRCFVAQKLLDNDTLLSVLKSYQNHDEVASKAAEALERGHGVRNCGTESDLRG